MGMGIRTFALGASLILAACSPEPAAPVANQATNETAAMPSPAPVANVAERAPASPLGAWLVGSWSFEDSCATDFVVHYNADGSLQNGEDSGSWALDGDALTETIVERFEMGADAPQKVEPAERRTYTVRQVDQGHGVITFQNRDVPILRC